MATATFNDVMSLVLGHEGGYVNNPKDPGGPTNMGITQKTLSGFLGRPATIKEVQNLSRERAVEIYRRSYWTMIRGDALPAGLDYALLDFAINSGPDRAIRTLQKIIGVGVDGVLGDQTMLALDAAAKADEIGLITAVCAERLAFMKRLKTWKTFGKGWTIRVNEVHFNAVRLATDDPTYGPITASAGTAKAREADTKVLSTSEGKAFTVAGLTAIGGFLTDVVNLLQPMAETSIYIKAGCLTLSVGALGVGLWVKMKQIQETAGKVGGTANA